MSEQSKAPEVIGALIGQGSSLVLMTLAALALDGPLSWALWAWVAFTVACHIALTKKPA